MSEKKKCIVENNQKEIYLEKLPEIIQNIAGSCAQNQCFDNVNQSAIPSKENIIEIIE